MMGEEEEVEEEEKEEEEGINGFLLLKVGGVGRAPMAK